MGNAAGAAVSHVHAGRGGGRTVGHGAGVVDAVGVAVGHVAAVVNVGLVCEGVLGGGGCEAMRAVGAQQHTQPTNGKAATSTPQAGARPSQPHARMLRAHRQTPRPPKTHCS